MKTQIIRIVSLVLISFITTVQAQDARELITKVVKANGGVNGLHKLKDVSYTYTFKVADKNIEDVSEERYIFNKEISFAKYTKRQVYALPQMKGSYTQFFNGTKTISKLDDKIITEQQPAYIGHALRKTNYYWFAMMFKLLDPGVQHKLLSEKDINGVSYKRVEMTFGENIGEASDKFILYINPKTFRVDQFLFTAKGFGVTEPSLMKVTYEKVNGVYISSYRKYASADWKGNVIKESWTEQYTKNIKFNNNFSLESIQTSF